MLARSVCAGARARWVATSLLALAWALAVPSALAADPTCPGPTPAEEQLYRQGKELAAVGQWKPAVQRFEAVLAKRSSAAAWIALGVAKEHLPARVEAWECYERAAHAPCGTAELAKKARELAAGLETEIGIVELEVGDVPHDLELRVTVDGRAVFVAGRTVAVDPGEHALVVEAPGYPTAKEQADVKAGERKAVRVDLRPDPAETGPETPESPSSAALEDGEWHFGALRVDGERPLWVVRVDGGPLAVSGVVGLTFGVAPIHAIAIEISMGLAGVDRGNPAAWQSALMLRVRPVSYWARDAAAKDGRELAWTLGLGGAVYVDFFEEANSRVLSTAYFDTGLELATEHGFTFLVTGGPLLMRQPPRCHSGDMPSSSAAEMGLVPCVGPAVYGDARVGFGYRF